MGQTMLVKNIYIYLSSLDILLILVDIGSNWTRDISLLALCSIIHYFVTTNLPVYYNVQIPVIIYLFLYKYVFPLSSNEKPNRNLNTTLITMGKTRNNYITFNQTNQAAKDVLRFLHQTNHNLKPSRQSPKSIRNE